MPPPEEEAATVSRFEQLLIDIVTDELGDPVDAAVVARIRTILLDDGLDSDDQVPGWIFELFQSLRDQQTLEVREQPDPSTDADITEFFSDLQDVAPFDCYDHGEWARIRLSRHGMLGFFSRQDAFYTTAKLDDVADDGLSDISNAKMQER